MVYITGNKPKRTPMRKFFRRLIGVAAIACIIFVLWQIPYDILREERFRLYGEISTTGLVTEVRTVGASSDGNTFFIDYNYIDQDGIARTATAPLPKEIWQKFSPGNRVEVIYAGSQPHLARIHGEIEPPFQIWLRNLLH